MRNFVLLISLFSVLQSFSHSVILDGVNEESINLSSFLRHYEDTTLGKSFVEVDNLSNKFWQNLGEKGAVFGHERAIHWLKFDVSNSTNKEVVKYLYFAFNSIYRVEVFDGEMNISIDTVGTSINFDDKPFPDRNYQVPLVFRGLEQKEIILKITNLNTAPKLPVFLLSENEVLKIINHTNSSLFFWRGMLTFSIIFSLIIFIYTRQKMFLYYAGLNISAGLFIGFEMGGIFYLIDSDPTEITMSLRLLANAMVLFFFTLFINSMINFSKISERIWKIFKVVLIITLLMSVPPLIPIVRDTGYAMYFDIYFMIISALLFLIQWILIIVGVSKKIAGSKTLLIIYSIYIFIIFYAVITPNLGIHEQSIYSYDWVFAGSIFEITAFLFLMAKESFKIYFEREELVRYKGEEQSHIINAIVQGQEEERDRIGKELHDKIGGNLSVLKMKSPNLSQAASSVLNETISTIRNLSHELVSPDIKSDTFREELDEMAVAYSSEELKMNVMYYDWPLLKDKEVMIHLYRIFQELLTNAYKHSRASEVYFQFMGGEELRVTYEDNGVGFDVEKKNSGIGIKNIKYRVAAMNGSFIMDSYPEAGTTICIELPNLNN